jgi:hypothetical protein
VKLHLRCQLTTTTGGQAIPDLDADEAHGISLRHDWGPQYRSAHFLSSTSWLGIADDAAFLGEPETNGCAERWIRTLKEQCLWAQLHDTVDKLRQAVSTSWRPTTPSGWSDGSATAPRRRPTRTPPRPQRHDQIDDQAVQPTGRCSMASSLLPWSSVPMSMRVDAAHCWQRQPKVTDLGEEAVQHRLIDDQPGRAERSSLAWLSS